MPDVLSVEADQVMQPDTSSTPDFLGLTGDGGLWAKLGGKGSAGEDVVIGIVDTGIWPEHPSFSDRTGTNPKGKEGKLGYQQLPGWHGKCTPGEEFNASHCNQKLIAAQYFVTGFGADRVAGFDYLSPRDFNGHGSHTASTAGGNADVPATGPASVFGSVSGMAPRARIAAYKVCWEEEEGDGGCNTSDSVAAIDQAVADGVDVINFSISGTTTSFLSSVEVAFLFAADAGVFVAASAGNNGPGGSTVAHPSPWLTTVAASTHNRAGEGSADLGNGTTVTGASVANATSTAPLVYSGNVGMAGADQTEVELCYPGRLDPAKVTGTIVLCDRGVIARVDKSRAVEMAGGIGMIMRNLEPSSLNADFHFVPTVHTDEVQGAAVKAYIDSAGGTATAKINEATITFDARAPIIASFSSRGPSRASADQLKPDLTAPGVDVLAAVSPAGNNGREFDLVSGTSMSSPHVAGLAALLIGGHRDWSPMMVKSALMTTAYDVLDGVSPVTKTFRQGAGHVDPTAAYDPGLVYDHGFTDWLGFLCGTGQLNASFCPGLAIDPSDLNLASIAIGQLAGIQTVKRTVTNVSSSAGIYTASASGLPGIEVSVSPSPFSIDPGESQELEITFTRTTAPLNSYQAGFVTLSDGAGHTVRSPVVIRPVALAAPVEISGSGTEGSTSFQITAGYDGSLEASPQGLVAADTDERTVQDDPTNNFNPSDPAGNQGIQIHTIAAPAGTPHVRIQLFDEFTDGNDDLDLFVYNSAGQFVAFSAGGTSAEVVNLTPPAAGETYTAYVHGWQTDGPDAVYTLFSWVIPSSDSGNMTVTAPSTVTTGATYGVDLEWSGLTADTKYLGRIRYSDGSTTVGSTIVAIDG